MLSIDVTRPNLLLFGPIDYEKFWKCCKNNTKHSFTFSLMDTKLIFAPIYWKNQKTSMI